MYCSVVGGLRMPLSRQGRLRRGWPLGSSSCVLEEDGGGKLGRGSLACSELDDP